MSTNLISSTPTGVPMRSRGAYLAGRQAGRAAADLAPLPDDVARAVVRVLDERPAARS